MNKIKFLLKCGLLEVIRFILFVGVIVFSAGLGMILYKIYESHFESAYILEAIPYLLECVGYLVGAYFLDKFLFKHLMLTRQFVKNA